MAKATKIENQGEEKKVRTTLFINPSLITRLDDIARRRAVKESRNFTRTDLIAEALEEYAAKWDKKL